MTIFEMNEVMNSVKNINSDYDYNYVSTLKDELSELIKRSSIDFETRQTINEYLNEISIREYLYENFNDKENEMTEESIDEIRTWLVGSDEFHESYQLWLRDYFTHFTEEVCDLQEFLKETNKLEK